MAFDSFLKITSSQNSQIKKLKKLGLKKYRAVEKSFGVESFVIIRDALKSGFDFQALFVTSEFIEKHSALMDFFKKNSASREFYLIDEKINKYFSQLETPSGIMAVYPIKNKELSDESVIYLEDLNDPGNLGTIMRSALAFGFKNLVLSKNCVDAYSPKTISAARDAIFKLNIIEKEDEKWLEGNRLPVYITSSHDGLALTDFRPADKFCLVLGSESHGVKEGTIKKAQGKIRIEMSSDMESLNVASAAAILLYALRKKS